VAAGYDRWYEPAERAGLDELRRRTLADVSGRVLEIGAGTGLNLPYYPSSAEEIVLAEPDPPMARRLSARLAGTQVPGKLLSAPAEALPFEDSSFDWVVSSFVLCTVPELERALTEIKRVLRPGGKLAFLEHIRSTDPKLARWQDRLHGAWFRLGNGCHCNRRTVEGIEREFELGEVSFGDLPKAPFLWRPFALGTASAA
jgi:ubiquinone/menaquinone biosynthesis C-methylase UbiE